MVLKLNLESILRKEPSERTPVELTFAAARLMDVELLAKLESGARLEVLRRLRANTFMGGEVRGWLEHCLHRTAAMQ